MTIAVRRRYVESRFGQLHLREAGAGAHGSPPIVLLHQTPSTSFEYEPLMRELATDRRVLAFDTPGYGASDAPPEPLSMTDYAAAIADGLEAVGLAEEQLFDVYGFHTGALLAIEMALALPRQVRRIALTGIPMRSPAERQNNLAKAREPQAIDEDGTVALLHAGQLWDYVVAQRTQGIPLERQAALWLDKLRAFDKSRWAYVGVWSYDYARLKRVRQPTLLIQPAEAIRDVSIEAVRLIPDHTIAELPQFRRDVLDLPDAVRALAKAMRGFLGATVHLETHL